MKYKQLTREQRYGIYLGIQEGKSKTAIAQQIGVHPSTVCREIHRNSWQRQHGGWYYTYARAHENAVMRREHRPGNRLKPKSVTARALSLLQEEQCNIEVRIL